MAQQSIYEIYLSNTPWGGLVEETNEQQEIIARYRLLFRQVLPEIGFAPNLFLGKHYKNKIQQLCSDPTTFNEIFECIDHHIKTEVKEIMPPTNLNSLGTLNTAALNLLETFQQYLRPLRFVMIEWATAIRPIEPDDLEKGTFLAAAQDFWTMAHERVVSKFTQIYLSFLDQNAFFYDIYKENGRVYNLVFDTCVTSLGPTNSLFNTPSHLFGDFSIQDSLRTCIENESTQYLTQQDTDFENAWNANSDSNEFEEHKDFIKFSCLNTALTLQEITTTLQQSIKDIKLNRFEISSQVVFPFYPKLTNTDEKRNQLINDCLAVNSSINDVTACLQTTLHNNQLDNINLFNTAWTNVNNDNTSLLDSKVDIGQKCISDPTTTNETLQDMTNCITNQTNQLTNKIQQLFDQSVQEVQIERQIFLSNKQLNTLRNNCTPGYIKQKEDLKSCINIQLDILLKETNNILNPLNETLEIIYNELIQTELTQAKQFVTQFKLSVITHCLENIDENEPINSSTLENCVRTQIIAQIETFNNVKKSFQKKLKGYPKVIREYIILSCSLALPTESLNEFEITNCFEDTTQRISELLITNGWIEGTNNIELLHLATIIAPLFFFLVLSLVIATIYSIFFSHDDSQKSIKRLKLLITSRGGPFVGLFIFVLFLFSLAFLGSTYRTINLANNLFG